MTVIKKAIVKSYDAASHKAAVQIAGSLGVWLEGIRVATDIPAADVVVDRQCTVLFIDPSNQDDALVLTIQGANPSTPSGATVAASATVVSETAFGQASAPGAASPYSRGDHTHGTPTDPVPAHEALADPHTVYGRLADAETIAGQWAKSVAPAAATDLMRKQELDDHAAAADPHTVYARTGQAETWAALQTFNAGILLPDNAKALFGTGSDAAFWFNGTDLIIDPTYGGAAEGDIIINVDGDFNSGALAFGAAVGGDVRTYWDGSKWIFEGAAIMRFDDLTTLELPNNSTIRWVSGIGHLSAAGTVVIDLDSGANTIALIANTLRTNNPANISPGGFGIETMEFRNVGGGLGRTTIKGPLAFNTPTTLTISGGLISVKRIYHKVETEGGAASDDLIWLSGAAAQQFIILTLFDAAHVVTVKEGGNLKLDGGRDFVMDDLADAIMFFRVGASYLELSRSTTPATTAHDLLDGSTHPDTVAQGVTRGSIIRGDSTPNWNELLLGAAGTYLRSDGTDILYSSIQDADVPSVHSGSAHHTKLAFTEAFTVLTNPTATGTWETESATPAPANSIAIVLMRNPDTNDEEQMGVREVGSSLARIVDINEAFGGGENTEQLAVNVDGSGNIQLYREGTATGVSFVLVGYWS